MFPSVDAIIESIFQYNYYCLKRVKPSVCDFACHNLASEDDLDSEYNSLIPICDHSEDTNAAVPRSDAEKAR